VRGVVGVSGGFVVHGPMGADLVAVHYDLASRSARLHVLCAPCDYATASIYYFPEFHSVVARVASAWVGVDLATGDRATSSPTKTVLARGRAADACIEAARHALPSPRLRFISFATESDWSGGYLQFSEASGTLRGRSADGLDFVATPLADGRPMLRGASLHEACCAGPVLAFAASGGRWGKGRSALCLIHAPDGAVLREYPHKQAGWGFTLSRDGRQLARRVGECRLEVTNLESGQPTLFPRFGGFHAQVSVELGRSSLVLRTGEETFLLHWESGMLQVRSGAPGGLAASRRNRTPPSPGVRSTGGRVPDLACYDSSRFISGVNGPVCIVIDFFGQVALIDRAGGLACMFFAFHSEVRAWMPDGTRWPEAGRTDGPAASAIGAALVNWQLGRSTTS
jgi:hypothetical protein